MIKTSEILENISIVGQETTMDSTLSDNFQKKIDWTHNQMQKITLDQTCTNDFEAFSNNCQLFNMRIILKIYRNSREK